MMNFERLERAWNGPANTPTEAASVYVMNEIQETLKRRRHGIAVFTGFVGLVLIGWTAKIAFEIIVDPFPFDLAREWAVIPLFALPWVGLFLINAQQRRHMIAHPDPYASVHATLRGLLDENGMARRRLIITTGLMTVCALLMILMLGQLMAVGKMTPTNVTQGAIAFGGLMTAIAAYKAWHYLRVLRPEGERLKRLLAEYSA